MTDEEKSQISLTSAQSHQRIDNTLSSAPEEFGEDDARSMSPRRSMVEIDQLSNEAKALLEEQAKALQSGLLALLERVEKVKEEHVKLEIENKVLQEYIGSLMKMTDTKGSGRVR